MAAPLRAYLVEGRSRYVEMALRLWERKRLTEGGCGLFDAAGCFAPDTVQREEFAIPFVC